MYSHIHRCDDKCVIIQSNICCFHCNKNYISCKYTCRGIKNGSITKNNYKLCKGCCKD